MEFDLRLIELLRKLKRRQMELNASCYLSILLSNESKFLSKDESDSHRGDNGKFKGCW